MRVTRAAQRAQQDVDEHAEAPEVNERALKDIEPNTSPAAQTDEPLPTKTPAKTPAKKTKGKAGKKSARNKKARTDEEEAQDGDEVEVEAASSAANEWAEQEPAQGCTDDIAEDPKHIEQPTASQTPSIRLTRRQLAKLEEEEGLSNSQNTLAVARDENTTDEPAKQAAEDFELAAAQEDGEAAPEAATTVVQEESTNEPVPAPKSARRTRRQQTNPEEDKEIVNEVAENITSHDREEPEALDSIENATETAISTTANRAAAPIEPEVAAKPKRLTRRQLAKLEEEQQRAQIEEQLSLREGRQGAIETVAVEAQVEEVGEKEEIIEPTGKEATDFEKSDTLARTAGEHLNTEEEHVTEPRRAIEEEGEPVLLRENEIVEEQVSSPAQEIDASNAAIEARPATPSDAEFEAELEAQVDEQVADEIIPSIEATSEAEPKMLCDEKPFETFASTPVKNQDSIRHMSRSPTKSPMRIEESISAIDRLEEDLESIGTAIPDLDHSEDEKVPQTSSQPASPTATRGKTPSRTPAKTPARTPARAPAKSASKTPSKTPAKAPAVAKPPPAAKASLSTKISRVPSAPPKSVKPTATSLARASSVRAAPSKGVRQPSSETADYLASKRRPISLSFPTPPPPPKGRAPTKPTFQLSSENVAAKLRAQKEERLKREAEGTVAQKQRPISMPPPPKSTKAPTVPSFQLPGEATAARLKAQKEERLKRMEEAGADKKTARPISMPPPPKSTKPPTKPNFQLPGEATAARLKAQKEERLKRMEEAEAARKAAASAAAARKPIVHRPRQSLLVKDAPGISIPPPSQPSAEASQRSASLASKRSSLIGPGSRSTSTSSTNRTSVLLAEGGKSTLTPSDAAALKNKGRQVFNRDKMEKEAVERERREKEEAAKKARAEAAERGRIASREWAERQKRKMMGQ